MALTPKLAPRVPAPISEALTSYIQELAVKAFHGIGAAGVARTDFLLKEEKVYFNEINTLPGSLAFYLWEASGVPFDELVHRAVDIAFEQYQIRSATQFTFDANLLQSG